MASTPAPVSPPQDASTPAPEEAPAAESTEAALGDATAPPSTPIAVQTIQQLVDQRHELDRTLLASETEAQSHEQTFVRLWDNLLSSEDPYEVFRQFPFTSLRLGSITKPVTQDWGIAGISVRTLDSAQKSLDREDFHRLLSQFEQQGWKVEQTEWHHSKFEPGSPPRSHFSFEIHARNESRPHRVILRGTLLVDWSGNKDASGRPIARHITAQDVAIIARPLAPPFAEVATIDPTRIAPEAFPRVSPLILYDLNGDGLSEIILAGCNQVLRNLGNNNFDSGVFLKHGFERMAEAGIVADFTGDGHPDFIGASVSELQLRLFAGNAAGEFSAPSRICFDKVLENPHSLSAGDVDQDGDLDLYVGQWRPPYDRGSMPTPYYDAHDGHPDYLLLNDGSGTFTDATEAFQLAPRRNRRTFSASLVDLDGDRDLDLLRVSDFAGLDIYRNEGGTKFTDVTNKLVDERHAFGMSHTMQDFDGDGQLDLYMIGMSSTTARRLDQLGITRPDFEDYTQFRMKMAYGNRMYLSRNGRLEQPAFRDRVARTGWSWGCTSTDFDNDGDIDIYVANGHISGKSTRDYCTRFWCHDIYDGSSSPNTELDGFYKRLLGDTLGKQVSWNGYEHNAFYLNLDGRDFLNAAYLLGVAFEFDARSVVSDDLDGDGLREILVVEFDAEKFQQRLHIARNRCPDPGNWVGVQLREHGQGRSPLGATVSVTAGGRTRQHQILTGDSFLAQHANTAHFGLGATEGITAIEVTWADGSTQRLEQPAVNTYHAVSHPGR